MNRILGAHGIGYRLAPPNLETLGEPAPLIEVVIPAATRGRARTEVIRAYLSTALLIISSGGRIALRDGIVMATGQRDYHLQRACFAERPGERRLLNTIVGDLRRLQLGGVLPHATRWMEALYGYLSAPGGGQIRHGMNLSNEIQLNRNEARLYCNLIRSYMDTCSESTSASRIESGWKSNEKSAWRLESCDASLVRIAVG